MIRVVLVDDHDIVREGLRHLVERQPDIRVVGSFGDGATAARHAASLEADIALIDIAMPGLNGLEVVRQMRRVAPSLRAIMLSMHADFEYVFQAMQAGAKGYLIKETAGEEVVEALRTVHAGQRFLSRGLDAARFAGFLRTRVQASPLERLSERERQVLQLVVEGQTSAEIAAQLNLSPKSVETYRSRMLTKLAIDDLPGLVKFAIRHGLTTIG